MSLVTLSCVDKNRIIEFEKDQLVAELGSLFRELVGLDILEVRAKG